MQILSILTIMAIICVIYRYLEFKAWQKRQNEKQLQKDIEAKKAKLLSRRRKDIVTVDFKSKRRISNG